MGGDRSRQGAPLAVRLADQANVAETQVAQPAVHELRRGARRPRAEVARVDERDGEPFPRSVRGGRRSDHAAADHEQVERRPLERLAAGGFRQSGFVHAFLPHASTTSTRAKGAVSGRSSRAATTRSSGVVSSTSAPWLYPSLPAFTAVPLVLPVRSVTDRAGVQRTTTSLSRASTSWITGPVLP